MNKTITILRDPAEESINLYPGLSVMDTRVTGSITVQRSRLPLWAFIGMVIEDGWAATEAEYEVEEAGWDRKQMSDFLHDLLQARGEFARLVLVIANCERQGPGDETRPRWYQREDLRQQVQEQLQHCLKALEDE